MRIDPPLTYIVIAGSPADGFLHIGPFDDMDEATAYAEHHLTDGDWWCVLLDAPAPMPTALPDLTNQNVAFLRDLAERLMHVPAEYGTDQVDVDTLHSIASNLEK